MQNLNTIDWILLGLVAVLAILAVRSVLKSRRRHLRLRLCRLPLQRQGRSLPKT